MGFLFSGYFCPHAHYFFLFLNLPPSPITYFSFKISGAFFEMLQLTYPEMSSSIFVFV